MDIIFKGRQTDVPARFREYATVKLNRLEKLDAKALRVDVEVSVERNPRQASQKERVELTVRSRGPAIRAEAAAEDRLAALDLALAKLDSRLRRALDRRKSKHVNYWPDRLAYQAEPEQADLPEGAELAGLLSADDAAAQPDGAQAGPAQAGTARAGTGRAGTGQAGRVRAGRSQRAAVPRPAGPAGASEGAGGSGIAGGAEWDGAADGVHSDSVVPIKMEGDGPLVVRQKFHRADPISIDQALFEMELVGHDFYLFHDVDKGLPSVVYRRRGYQYGVIRLVENSAGQAADGSGAARPDSRPAATAQQSVPAQGSAKTAARR